MSRLDLTGLIGSNPLAALASFGLLRVLDQAGITTRLGYTMRDDWIAFIECDAFFEPDDLIAWLNDWVAQRQTPELEWAKDVRVPPNTFRDKLIQAASNGSEQAFLSAMATEGIVDQSKGLVKPGPLYMASGQQSFLRGLREIFADVRRHSSKRFNEALWGPWRYSASLHSMGWDPAAERIHALRAKAPTAEKPACVSAAVWLAYEAMPLLPTFAAGGRVRCASFQRENKQTVFWWPVFDQSMAVNELKSLLHTGAYRSQDGSLRRGIAATYSAQRYEFGQGYAVFRPGAPAQSRPKPPHHDAVV